jgi:hypothetical protein
LQTRLDAIPVSLILIADGRGMAETPEPVLRELFESVGACMTLRQAESGDLDGALLRAMNNRGQRRADRAPLGRIIETSLEARGIVRAAELPVPSGTARLALARFAEDRSELALALSPLGESLSWQREHEIQMLRQSATSFNPSTVYDVFANLMDAATLEQHAVALPPDLEASFARVVEVDLDLGIPPRFVVVSHQGEASDQIYRMVAAVSLAAVPDARLSVLLVSHAPTGRELKERNQFQSTLPANVVVLDVDDLTEMARSSKNSKSLFVHSVIQQADLTKVSPFVVSNFAPRRIFFGREVEEATLLATLSSNSVALLGGRRIGKTSLMRHVLPRLQESGFRPFLGDCQTVRTWQDFGRMAHRRWGITVPKDFSPAHLDDLVDRLSRGHDEPVVILLDEIDQLLDWDQQHEIDEVPEAFFRACRAISQDGRAQFVFSGERIIARRLWDPHSPHWNFCRPLPLQQLTQEHATELLMRPLAALQIEVDRHSEFETLAWQITSGHPQILQFVGDLLVRSLNERPPTERARLTLADLQNWSDSFELREHYLETYWGQATKLERLISLYVILGNRELATIVQRLEECSIAVTEGAIAEALRMLELYGILNRSGPGYGVRAEWFPVALDSYGGVHETVSHLEESIE